MMDASKVGDRRFCGQKSGHAIFDKYVQFYQTHSSGFSLRAYRDDFEGYWHASKRKLHLGTSRSRKTGYRSEGAVFDPKFQKRVSSRQNVRAL